MAGGKSVPGRCASVPNETYWLLEMGHSRLKWARWDRGREPGNLAATGVAAGDADREELLAAMVETPGAGVVLAAVPMPERVAGLTGALDAAGIAWRRVETGRPALAVAPAYPGLGVDRWLALQWPWLQRGEAFCVADCGTAVTVDVVDGGGVHIGGWILPGIDASAAGLVARAPGLANAGREDPVDDPRKPGENTRAGLTRGLLLQLAGGIRACQEAAGNVLGRRPALWLTGGDAPAVRTLLDAEHADAHLVLHGLALASEAGP